MSLQVSASGGTVVILAGQRNLPLPLSPGVPFPAEVLECEGGRALLAVHGQLLRCETSLALEAGTRVWLAVREASPQRVVLALVADPVPAGAGGETPDALPPEEATAFPLGLGSSLDTAPPPAALARAIRFLSANGRPVMAEAVQSVACLFVGRTHLGHLLADLATELPAADFAGQPLSSFAEAFFDPCPPASVSPGSADLAEQAERLATALRHLGRDHELRLAHALLNEDPQGNARHAAVPEVASGDLKGLLLALRARLESGAPSRLASLAEEALRHLTGQQLLAPAGGGPGQEELTLFLQIPLLTGGQPQTAEIRLYREAKSKRNSRPPRLEALRLSCRLTTERLGPVRVDLALRPRGVSQVHLYLNSEPVADLFRSHEPELREILTQAGLQVGRVTYAVATGAPAATLTAAPSGAAASITTGTLDVRL